MGMRRTERCCRSRCPSRPHATPPSHHPTAHWEGKGGLVESPSCAHTQVPKIFLGLSNGTPAKFFGVGIRDSPNFFLVGQENIGLKILGYWKAPCDLTTCTYKSSESIFGKIRDYYWKVSIKSRTLFLVSSRKFYVVF